MMAVGWAKEGAVQDQIDASINDAINLARKKIKQGKSLTHCEECGEKIPAARQRAVPGVHLCINCQNESDHKQHYSLYNRSGSKDSQLR